MYVLSQDGSVLSAPSPKPYPHKPPKCSDCSPLFMKVRLVYTPLITVISEDAEFDIHILLLRFHNTM